MKKNDDGWLLFVCIVLIILGVAVISTGCSLSSDGVIEEHRNKIVVCVDTRDNSVFTFNTNTIENARIGYGAPHSMDITTLDGTEMTVTSDAEAWLKCEMTEVTEI